MNYFYWKRTHGEWQPHLRFDSAPVIHKEDRERYSTVQKTELVDLDQCVRVWPAPREKSDG
jgi:hypothetical protein